MNAHDLKVFTDLVEPSATHQIYTLLATPPFRGAKVRIMPDVHVGSGAVVGFTSTMGDKVIPNVIGVDIGCGMLAVNLGKSPISYEKLDAFVRDEIPSGSSVHAHPTIDERQLRSLRCYDRLSDMKRLLGSCGTLGGGNHFIEVDVDEDGEHTLVIHSGSRNLGLQVAKIYQRRAVEACKTAAEEERKTVTTSLKQQNRLADIDEAMREITLKYADMTKTPSELCFLMGQGMADYLHDVRICQQFATESRRQMAEAILRFAGIPRLDGFETVHNYIDDDSIIRKGAIAAPKGTKLIIPMNMQYGCLIGVGLGNEDWNQSAPHGAGRLFSRSETRELLSMEAFHGAMAGIYTTSVSEGTLDESPMAYKSPDEIISRIEPTALIEKVIRPVYNFKAGSR